MVQNEAFGEVVPDHDDGRSDDFGKHVPDTDKVDENPHGPNRNRIALGI